MLTVICIAILASLIIGKIVKARRAKTETASMTIETPEPQQQTKPQSQTSESVVKRPRLLSKVGRVVARPFLQFYYAITAETTSNFCRAQIFAGLIYVLSPIDFLPEALLSFLGILDDGLAVVFVYKTISDKITPEVNARVDAKLNRWFPKPTKLITQ